MSRHQRQLPCRVCGFAVSAFRAVFVDETCFGIRLCNSCMQSHKSGATTLPFRQHSKAALSAVRTRIKDVDSFVIRRHVAPLKSLAFETCLRHFSVLSGSYIRHTLATSLRGQIIEKLMEIHPEVANQFWDALRHILSVDSFDFHTTDAVIGASEMRLLIPFLRASPKVCMFQDYLSIPPSV